MISRLPRFTVVTLIILTIIFLVSWLLIFADSYDFELGGKVVSFIISLIIWLLFAYLIGFLDKDKKGQKIYRLVSFWLALLFGLIVIGIVFVGLVYPNLSDSHSSEIQTIGIDSKAELYSSLEKVNDKGDLVNTGILEMTLVDIQEVEGKVIPKRCSTMFPSEECQNNNYYGLQFTVKNITTQQQTWNRFAAKIIYKDGQDDFPFETDLLSQFGESYDWSRRDYKLEPDEEVTGWQVVRVDRRRPDPIFAYALSRELPLIKWRLVAGE
ncbi:hypothetical protein KJ596_01740 [Patescibacteria group bacterium]|nr:hypothetical protein [Patescibacteria group bacterium]MBU1868376.1 hypothetical protein [Patescibacteria group bacterium]